LTKRELEIVAVLVDAPTNKEIGRKLGIAEPTVETHLMNITRKTGIATRLGIFALGVRLGLIPISHETY